MAIIFAVVDICVLGAVLMDRPFDNELERMYATDSYAVQAVVQRRYTRSRPGTRTSTEYILEVEYVYQGSSEDEEMDTVTGAVRKVLSKVPEDAYDEAGRNGCIELHVLAGFPLSGIIRQDMTNSLRIRFLGWFFACHAGPPLLMALAISPFGESTTPFTCLAVYVAAILTSVSVVFFSKRGRTFEVYRKQTVENNAVILSTANASDDFKGPVGSTVDFSSETEMTPLDSVTAVAIV